MSMEQIITEDKKMIDAVQALAHDALQEIGKQLGAAGIEVYVIAVMAGLHMYCSEELGERAATRLIKIVAIQISQPPRQNYRGGCLGCPQSPRTGARRSRAESPTAEGPF